MARSATCPKCHSSMVEGFVADRTDSGWRVSGWVEGTPEKNFWGGVKLRGKKPAEIATWRCRSCGFLESHAG